jgi:hypothetical protein
MGLMAVLLGYGCAPPTERFIPSEERAREALDSALETWRQGKAEGNFRLDAASGAVQVADSFRRSGQSLSGYEVLGKTPADGPHRFVVQLLLDHPAEQKTVRYVVVGVDPLWVIREEDYEMMERWQMYMGKRTEDTRSKK